VCRNSPRRGGAHREGAIRAYRHYLALRTDPEPPVAAQVAAVRAELRRLEGETVGQ
jgi:hypothetical protein